MKLKLEAIKDKITFLNLIEIISLFITVFITIYPCGSSRIMYVVSLTSWLISILINSKNNIIKFLKNNYIILLFILLWLICYLINIITGRADLLKESIFSYTRIASILFIGIYYMNFPEEKKFKTLLTFSLILVNIINVYTIIRNLSYYNLSRLLSTGLYMGENSQIAGVASYGYIYGLIFILIALIILFYKTIKDEKRILWFVLATILTSISVIIVTEFLIAIILLLLGIIIYFAKLYKIKRMLIFTITLTLLCLIFAKPISIIFHKMKGITSFSYNISERMEDIAYFFEGNLDSSLDIKTRFDVYNKSINTFTKHPIIGVGYNQYIFDNEIIGHHSTFIDEFGKYGIIGALPLFLMIYAYFYKTYKMYANEEAKKIYMTCIIVFTIFGFVNNILFVSTIFFAFILLQILLKRMDIEK